MNTPDSDHIAESENEVEITDLDASSGTSSSITPTRFTGQALSLQVRIGMGIGILAGVVLLGLVVLRSLVAVPQAAKGSPPPQVHYPLSMTVVDGTGYAITADGIVSAFRVSDGKLLWHHPVSNVGKESITVVNGVVYLVPSVLYNSTATTAPLVALRAADGSPLWSRALPWSEASFQLTVANGSVYIRTAVDTIEVLRATDGALLWKYTASPLFFSAVANGMVYVLTQDGQLTALYGNTGLRAWEYNTVELPGVPLPPIVTDGMVFLSLHTGNMDVLSADTGALRWRYIQQSAGRALLPQPLVAGGVVYALTQDGHLLALRASSGSPVWSITLRVSTPLPPLLVADGVIYVQTLDGSNVEAIRAGDGSVLWSYQGKAQNMLWMTVAQPTIYLAFPGGPGVNMIGSITALRASDGSTLWHYSPPIPATQFIPTGNLVLVALQDGNVTTLSASSGSVRWHRYVDG